jgi:hypothetical protein
MNFKLFLKNSVAVLLVSAIIAGVYMLYFYTVGVPKTQAKNYYNLALQEEEKGNILQAIKDLETAKSYWNEEYINIKLEELK